MIKNGMKMLGVILLAGLIMWLSSCDRGHGPEIDESVDFENQDISVTTTFYDDERNLVRKFLLVELGYEPTNSEIRDFIDNNNLHGFANLFYNVLPNGDVHIENPSPVCEIHMMRPRGQNDRMRMETLGHELLHCVYGTWHEKSDY